MADQQQSTSSVSAFVTTLIVNGILFSVFIGLFIILRPKEKRVYEPRHCIEYLPEEKRVEEPPAGAFGWLTYLLKKPEKFLLGKVGPDGYFFLRYLFIFGVICILGGFLLFPILFPVNATGGGGQQGFDIISFTNVANENRFYAHVFLSWFFFGLIVYTIYRELVYYVSFRHALQASPLYDSAISSRTIMLDNIPESLQDEGSLRCLFPKVSHVWYAREYKELMKKVKERTKLAGKYESTMNKVIKKSVKTRAKLSKKKKPLPEPADKLSSYFPEKKMPTHRLKFLIGEKVKTLEYSPKHISELNQDIGKKQENAMENDKVGTVFMEFSTQIEAQKAYQAIPYCKVLRKSRRFINIAPEDVIWDNTSAGFWTRHTKLIVAKSALTAMIIFWAFPVAVVGCISNVNFLTEKVPFLRFINNMPDVIMGIITGLLPTVALAILMSLIPPFIKFLGRFGGILTAQALEEWCQSWYFGFQVIQVFLVTTLASAATSAVTEVINDPSSAMVLLAQNLPKASNFYITYFLLQGLTIPSGALLQIVALILAQFLGKILDGTPRAKWNRYTTLGKPGFGVLYPIYQLMAVLMLCYSIISPIILCFAAITFVLIYIAFLYNLTYVMDHSFDARGRNYPKALFQSFVGLYLAEVCLLGLFVLAKSWGPVVLEAVFLAATVLAHLYFKRIFIPLFDAVPISALKETQGILPPQSYPANDHGLKEIKETGKNFFASDASGVEMDRISRAESSSLPEPDATESKLNDLAGAPSALSENNTYRSSKVPSSPFEDPEDPNQEGVFKHNLPVTRGFFMRYFYPGKYLTFQIVSKLIPYSWQTKLSYPEEFVKDCYQHPAVREGEPQLWILRDPYGLSTEQIENAGDRVDVTDDNAVINASGSFDYTGPPPDYEEAIKT